MTEPEILSWRLKNLRISESRLRRPLDVVRHLGLMQAQDYPGALWAIGLRLPDATVSDIEKAIAKKQIVRSWPVRGTLHFVAAEDLRWILELTSAKILKKGEYRERQLGLDEEAFARSRAVLAEAMRGLQLSRSECYARLEKEGVSTTGQRGIHLLWRLALEGLICFGSHMGKEPSFSLLDEWIPASKPKPREQALGELALRYFSSHGPATAQDLMRWAGLTTKEVDVGLNANTDALHQTAYGGEGYWSVKGRLSGAGTFLLPGFDEFILGYRDRSLAVADEHSQRVVPGGNGMFMPTIVIDGKVQGTWRRKTSAKKVTITLSSFRKLTQAELASIEEPAARYGRFLGLPAELELES